MRLEAVKIYCVQSTRLTVTPSRQSPCGRPILPVTARVRRLRNLLLVATVWAHDVALTSGHSTQRGRQLVRRTGCCDDSGASGAEVTFDRSGSYRSSNAATGDPAARTGTAQWRADSQAWRRHRQSAPRRSTRLRYASSRFRLCARYPNPAELFNSTFRTGAASSSAEPRCRTSLRDSPCRPRALFRGRLSVT